jgi:hypothetical protein
MVEFWTPADWLQYSPYLNLLDFSIWSILQEIVQACPTPVKWPYVNPALEPDVAGLHPPDLLLFPPPPGGRHGENGGYIK